MAEVRLAPAMLTAQDADGVGHVRAHQAILAEACGGPVIGRLSPMFGYAACMNNPVRREDGRLTVALVSEVFWEPDGLGRLAERLDQCAQRGADLAVLPELPLHPWRPATKDAVDEDAEPMDGPRAQAQATAAQEAGIGLVGGIIHGDPATGRRTSRVLVFDRSGELVATYEKLHLPEEPGFWETSHYEPGTEAPGRIDAFGLPIGVQVCSDSNRPEGSHLLGAQGAQAILIPRATEEKTYQRWKIVFRANALTSCSYVLSVNRPDPEAGVLIGGPSIAVDPNGTVLVETTDRVALVTLEARVVSTARTAYPGYLPVRARLYADAWGEIAGRDGEPS
jgi:deaminated glutathione amidase